MKIVMLCDFYSEKLEYQENLLTKYYEKHGHEVVVITSTFDSVFDYYEDRHDSSVSAHSYKDGQATIHKLPFRINFLSRIRVFTSIMPILDAEQPDLIYVHDIMLNVIEAVRYMKRTPDCKMIMDYHADYSNSGKNWVSLKILHGLIRKSVLDYARPYLSKIFPIVPAGVTFLNEVYKVPVAEMEVLPLGADLSAIDSVADDSGLEALRREYGITPESPVVLTGGKLSERKQTELLIRGFRQIEDPHARLLILGEASPTDTTYFNLLKREASGDDRIHFVGWQDRVGVYSHLAISTVAVFPASQSILWQQAIASGLPLIAGNTGHQSIEYLNLYENLVVLEQPDINVNKIRTELLGILSDPVRRKRMADGARKVGREVLNWDVLMQKTLQFNI